MTCWQFWIFQIPVFGNSDQGNGRWNVNLRGRVIPPKERLGILHFCPVSQPSIQRREGGGRQQLWLPTIFNKTEVLASTGAVLGEISLRTEVTLCICHRPKLVLAMTPESARDLSPIFLFFSARLCFGPHLAAEANVNQSQKNCGAIKFGWWNVIVIVKTWPRA